METTDVIQKSVIQEIRIFPNPTHDQFTVYTKGLGRRSLELISLSGQVVKKMSFFDRNVEVDISSFQDGVYFLRINSTHAVSTGRIMKY
jgi:hypothetical protein